MFFWLFCSSWRMRAGPLQQGSCLGWWDSWVLWQLLVVTFMLIVLFLLLLFNIPCPHEQIKKADSML